MKRGPFDEESASLPSASVLFVGGKPHLQLSGREAHTVKRPPHIRRSQESPTYTDLDSLSLPLCV